MASEDQMTQGERGVIDRCLTKIRRDEADVPTMPEEFFSAYVEAALWSSLDDSDVALDQNFDASNIAFDTAREMRADCLDFWMANWSLVASNPTRAGHDFWLNRNRHGSGFWDGGWGAHGYHLSEQCKPYGDYNLYVGDDGRIYGC